MPEIVTAILQTIELGWEFARKRSEVTAQAGEVVMTECLRDGMRSALSEHALPWRKTMIIAPGTESRSQAGMVAPDGRTDIPIYLTPVFEQTDDHDPHAIAECKRVSDSDRSLCREYVIEGIDRFITGKYSENHSRGFMIGYVLSGSTDGAVEWVNAYLVGRERTIDRLSENGCEVEFSGWTSVHHRSGNGDVTLHHIMLPVTAN